MTTQNQEAPAAGTKTSNPPLCYAPRKDAKDQNSPRTGLVLWPVNSDKEKAPDLSGILFINGEETRVIGYLREKKDDPSSKFISFTKVEKGGDGNDVYTNNFGSANAINTEDSKPLAADRTPYLLAKVGDKAYRGYMTAEGIPLMAKMGFSDEVIANFEKKLADRPAAPKP